MGTEKNRADTQTAWGLGLGAKWNLSDKTMLKADYYHVEATLAALSYGPTRAS